MILNRKGFTLIELLAVVVVLGLLVTVIGFTVTKNIKDSKEKLYKSQINSIISSTEMWVADHIDQMHSGCIYITLGTLQDGGYADTTIRNPITDSDFDSSNTYIKITITNISTNFSFSYEVKDTLPIGCTQFDQA